MPKSISERKTKKKEVYPMIRGRKVVFIRVVRAILRKHLNKAWKRKEKKGGHAYVQERAFQRSKTDSKVQPGALLQSKKESEADLIGVKGERRKKSSQRDNERPSYVGL